MSFDEDWSDAAMKLVESVSEEVCSGGEAGAGLWAGDVSDCGDELIWGPELESVLATLNRKETTIWWFMEAGQVKQAEAHGGRSWADSESFSTAKLLA